MSKVFVSMGMSLDGYVEVPNASLGNMGGDGWSDLHAWVFLQRTFRQRLKLGDGGETEARTWSFKYLNAGYVDELVLSVAPTLLGGGKRLFDGIDRSAVGVEIIDALCSPKVTHLRYAVTKKR